MLHPPCLVITALYSGSHVDELTQFFESLFSQDYANLALCIVVDGPLPSNTRSALTNSLNISPFPTKTIFNSSNLGLAASLNRAILWGISQGFSFFARADSDDIMVKNRISTLMKFLDSKPYLDACGSAYEYFGALQKVVDVPSRSSNIQEQFCFRTPIAHPTVLFKRSFFDKAGLYQPGFKYLIEDQRLWASAFRNHCKIENYPSPLYSLRVTRGFFYRRFNLGLQFHLFCLRLSYVCTNLRYILYLLPLLVTASLWMMISAVMLLPKAFKKIGFLK